MKKYLYTFILFILLLSTPITVSAEKPVLNKSNVTILCGKTYKIKANQKVSWKSSDKNIISINSNGKITGKGYGTAIITATNEKGEKSVCKIIVKKYIVKNTGNKRYPKIVTIHISGKKYRTYKVYNQKGFGSSYLNQRGCSHSSAAMVMSAYGKNYDSLDIHNGSVNKKCSEQYALKKLNKKVAITGKSLSVYSVSQILNNSGIKCHPVYKYKNANAIKEITNNLNEGRPVLIMCSRKTVNGVKLAKSYHFLVLIGIDENGYAIVLNAAGGTVNTSHCTGAFKLTVKELVENHMWSCTGSGYKSFYFNGSKNYGGYIIID